MCHGIMKMGNIGPRAGNTPKHLAFTTIVLPLDHLDTLISSSHTHKENCLHGSFFSSGVSAGYLLHSCLLNCKLVMFTITGRQ